MKFSLAIYGATVTLTLPVSRPDEYAPIEFEGDPQAVRRLQLEMIGARGMFGHRLGERTTAIDLHAALMSPTLAQFQPQLLEGAELLEGWRYEFPEDAKT